MELEFAEICFASALGATAPYVAVAFWQSMQKNRLRGRLSRQLARHWSCCR